MFRRLALIIGNNDYLPNKLINCINDASDMAHMLQQVGYIVNLQRNLNSEQMYRCIKDFTQSIQPNDFVIFFFSGHGVQWGDQNFLIPCDNDKIKGGHDIERYAINAQDIVDRMAEIRPHALIVLLDCSQKYWMPNQNCRDPSQPIGGLKQMRAPLEALIVVASASNNVSNDECSGSNNSVFTKYLLKHISTPGIEIERVLQRVARDVATETSNYQHLYRISSITTEGVYFVL